MVDALHDSWSHFLFLDFVKNKVSAFCFDLYEGHVNVLQVRDWLRRKASKDLLQRQDLLPRYEIPQFNCYFNI